MRLRDGQLPDHGRTERIVPPPLRRAVEIRDRHCVFTGCEASTHWTGRPAERTPHS